MYRRQNRLEIRSYKAIWSMCHRIRTAMRHRAGRYKSAGLIELEGASFGRKFKSDGKVARAGGTEKVVRVLVSTTGEGKPKFAKITVAGYAGVLHAQKMVREQVEPHHRESPKYRQRFLDEFAYRFNRRWVASQLFDRLLTACVNAPCVSFAELRN